MLKENQKAEDGSYRYPLHGDLPNIKTWADVDNERLRIETIPAKKWGDTEIAERGRSVLVMRARYRSARLTPHQRGWTDAG